MTKAISMAIELDQDMVTNMCLKFGDDWTIRFQELDRKTIFGTYVRNPICRHWGHKKVN